jgi:hypothetical protein
MDRREAIKRAVGLAAEAGVPVEASVVEVKPESRIVALVVKCDRPLSPRAHENIRTSMKQAFSATELKDCPVIVLQDGLSLEMVAIPAGQQPVLVPTEKPAPIEAEMDIDTTVLCRMHRDAIVAITRNEIRRLKG